MKNKLFLLLCIFVYISNFSQQNSPKTGINTNTPQKTLHINGSLQLTKELNVEGNASTPGNPGTKGEILTSQGDNVAPAWKHQADIGIPYLIADGYKNAENNYPSNLINGYAMVKFDNLLEDSNFIGYYNGSFRTNKSGYYQIISNLSIIRDYRNNGLFKILIDKNNRKFFRNDAYYNNQSYKELSQGIETIIYLAKGDFFTIYVSYNKTNEFKIGTSSISILFLNP